MEPVRMAARLRGARRTLAAPWRRSFGTTGAERSSVDIPVYSPRDGVRLSTVRDMSAVEVDELVTAARGCHSSSWSSRGNVRERARVLRGLGAAIRAQSDELARMETLNCGKPIRDSRADMAFCADAFEFYAEAAPRALAEQPIESLSEPPFSSRVVPSAAGVVVCVTPWNYPLMQAVAKVAPALAAGCSVLLKPSPLASLTCLKLEQLAREAGAPEGALRVVTGGPPASAGGGGAERLVSHPAIDRLSFTGSVRGGVQMLHASADHVRPTSLELGGKGAMIVFEDADLPSVVDWAMLGIFANAGQICSATSRLLVHRPIAEELLERLVRAAERVVVADPLDEATEVGPVVSHAQREAVLAAIDGARSEGARVLCGGGPAQVPGLEGGYYVQPTVLAGLPRTARAWRDEIFGPVLAVAEFDTEDEAVTHANDSEYGLAHAVMSADSQRCDRVGARLDAGSVWLNCSQAVFVPTPFGGWKRSGFGREWGEAAIDEYVRYKTVTAGQHGHSWGCFNQGG